MNRVTQDLQRVTYHLSEGEVCEAIRQYLDRKHNVVLPGNASFLGVKTGAQVVVEYPKEPKP